MSEKSIVQCDVKQIKIDEMEFHGVGVVVFVFANKQSVKRYCKDTGLLFKDGLRKLYSKQ